jgi:NDP-sugar pyrophosphorylase family protein
MERYRMINVLQLCAGQGSRFKEFSDIPKPFLDVAGKPMFVAALDSLNFDKNDKIRYHFLFQQSHIEQYNPAQYVDGTIHSIDYYTNGAATSAAYVIANSEYRSEEWMTIDCDFILDYNKDYFLASTRHASVVLAEERQWDLKSSYSSVDKDFKVYGIAEKQPISKYRNTGLYHWKSGDLFMDAYNFYANNNLLTNGEFYLAPLYNHAIQNDHPVKLSMVNKYTAIGTPVDYLSYLDSIR